MKQEESGERVLYNYFRSSSSYRVRIALNLKGLAYQYVPVHLSRGGGEQFRPEFEAVNPQQLVPVLRDRGIVISQSIAILEYLEEQYPATPLLPAETGARAWVRQLSLAAACDIHPLANLRVLKHLTGALGLAEVDKAAWAAHWTATGLRAMERELAGSGKAGQFCLGDTPTIADCCLVPQLFNARRFGVDLAPYPTLARINEACLALPAFERAAPARQPDAE